MISDEGGILQDDNHTYKYIYYKSSYKGKVFTCQQLNIVLC